MRLDARAVTAAVLFLLFLGAPAVPASAQAKNPDREAYTPLDWAGVTDHSEYVGVIRFANDPKSR